VSRHVKVVHRTSGSVLVEKALWCSSAWCRLRGFQFKRRLEPGEALLLAHPAEGVALSAIHMFFVFFPIAAIWIDSRGMVTTTTLARPWRPYYASAAPARYVLESSPDILDRISVGEEVDFLNLDPGEAG